MLFSLSSREGVNSNDRALINPKASFNKEGRSTDNRNGQHQKSTLQQIADHSPTVSQLKKFTTTVVQRYQVVNGAKVSANNALILEDEHTLYAADNQFTQANGLEGQITFNAGNAHAQHGALHSVQPAPAQNSQLAADTAHFNPLAHQAATLNAARDRYYPYEEDLTDRIWDEIEDHWNESNEEQRRQDFLTDDENELTNLIEAISGIIADILPAIGNFDESAVRQTVEQYFQQQQDLQHRPLMPSDCGEMATRILGAQPPQDAQPNIAAGQAYRVPQNLENREAAEWDYHVAAIIMTDGNDHVTMENAGAKNSEGFNKTQFDRSWFFEMYGPDEGQSFADRYNDDLGYGDE